MLQVGDLVEGRSDKGFMDAFNEHMIMGVVVAKRFNTIKVKVLENSKKRYINKITRDFQLESDFNKLDNIMEVDVREWS